MDPVHLLITLSIAGFLLIAAEVFVPGMVLGALGLISLAVAVGVSYANFGAVTGTIFLVSVATACFVGFIIWMNVFPQTAIGRRVLLKRNLESGIGAPAASRESLLGREGRALTPLRPAGTALIDGRKIDVVAESHFIDPGQPVVVVQQEGLRTVVRPANIQ